MTLHINTSKYGARQQSLHASNPRAVLEKLIAADPAKSKDELQEDCWHAIRNKPAHIRTVYEHWFTNEFRNLTRPAPATTVTAAKAATAQAVQTKKTSYVKQVKQKIDDGVRIVLLSMIMPTGKTLGDSTKEELFKFGGWFTRIGTRLQSGQTANQAGFTEEKVRQLYGGS